MSLALSLSEQCVVDNNGITAIQPAARSSSLSLLSPPPLSLSIYLSVVALLSLSVQLLSVVGVYYFGDMKDTRTVS